MPYITQTLDSIGKCEHCGAGHLLYRDPEPCPYCLKPTTYLSFGYERQDGGNRIKWVNAKSQWTTERPAEDFKWGDILVRVKPFYFRSDNRCRFPLQREWHSEAPFGICPACGSRGVEEGEGGEEKKVFFHCPDPDCFTYYPGVEAKSPTKWSSPRPA